MDPLNPECLMNLAAAYTSAGRNAEAVKALQTAAALQPQNPDIYQKLGQAYEKAGNEKLAAEAFSISKNLMQK
jgi:predicted Zn-dependent protease